MPRGPRPSGTFPAAGRAGDETAAGGGGTGSGGGSGGSDGGSSGGAGPSTGVVRPLASPGPMAMTSVDEEVSIACTSSLRNEPHFLRFGRTSQFFPALPSQRCPPFNPSS